MQARKAFLYYDRVSDEQATTGFLVEVVIAYEDIGRYDSTRKVELYEEALFYLEKAKEILDEIRKDLSYLTGLESFLDKRTFVGYTWY